MGCSASRANVAEDNQRTTKASAPERIPMEVRAQDPIPAPPPSALSRSPSNSSRHVRTHSQHSTRHSTDRSDAPSRSRVMSAPHQAEPTKSSSSQQSQNSFGPRKRASTSGVPRASHSTPRTPNPALPKAGGRSLNPTMGQVLSTSNNSKFRILVLGMKGSGKTSLIKTVFKVNLKAEPGRQSINREIVQEDNRYLIVHESSGFGPDDGQSSQTIRNFIMHRTDQGRPNSERLHAIWLCIPSDAISGSIGEGFQDILNLNRVPVIVVFTKFDQVVRIEDGDSARPRARARVEDACRSLFRKEPRDVPAEIVSVKPGFSDLIHNLVVTTDRLITGPRTRRRTASAPARSSAHEAKPRITPVPLMWSAALRVHQEIFIQASIEVGRSQYWRGLWSSLDFTGRSLKDCVNVIHTDIVEIWNLKDGSKHLSGSAFKEKMSDVVQDLAGSAAGAPSSGFAEWVHGAYRGSQENVRCVMGYIVDLTVILNDIFRTASGNVTANDVQSAVDRHVNTGPRDLIHQDIQSFVSGTFAIRFTTPQKDLVLEKIIDLIQQYCVPSRG